MVNYTIHHFDILAGWLTEATINLHDLLKSDVRDELEADLGKKLLDLRKKLGDAYERKMKR